MYFYHAHAIAFGGIINSTPLNVEQGSCALAVTGGGNSASTPKFDSQGIKFQSAQCTVSGQGAKNVFVTEASVVLQGLDIKNVITADTISATVKSTYTARDYEAVITATGTIKKLVIRGKEVAVTISKDFETLYTTFGSMQDALQNRYSQPFINCIVGHGLTTALATTSDLKAAYQAYEEQEALSELKSAVICSVVDGVSGLPDGVTGCGGAIIKIENFGTLYLGEVIVWPWMRCLNMFRVELVDGNNKPAGSISGASVGTNGTGFPPGYGPPVNGNGW